MFWCVFMYGIYSMQHFGVGYHALFLVCIFWYVILHVHCSLIVQMCCYCVPSNAQNKFQGRQWRWLQYDFLSEHHKLYLQPECSPDSQAENINTDTINCNDYSIWCVQHKYLVWIIHRGCVFCFFCILYTTWTHCTASIKKKEELPPISLLKWSTRHILLLICYHEIWVLAFILR